MLACLMELKMEVRDSQSVRGENPDFPQRIAYFSEKRLEERNSAFHCEEISNSEGRK